MRMVIAALLVLNPIPAIAAASTFTGSTNATFYVTENLDGTSSTATKTGQFNIALSTDFSTMQWTMDFNVNLVMSGGPTQSFETDLAATGSLNSTRCLAGSSCLGTNTPSTLSFPDASGKSGAGSYILQGNASWSLTDRIVSATRTRSSPSRLIATGQVNSTGNPVFVTPNHYLTVANYPNSITLTPGFVGFASYEDPTTSTWTSTGYQLDLGRIISAPNDYLDVAVAGFPTTVTLTEALAGDFNDSKTVDMSDYVLWRESPGVLSPFLTSYNVWRSDFGATAAPSGSSVAVPEPGLSSLLCAVFGIVALGRVRGQRRVAGTI